MFDNLKQLFDLRKKAEEVKKELSHLTVEGARLDGQIKVKLTGELKIVDLEIAPGLLKEENKDLIISNLKDCLNEAHQKIKSVMAEKMKGALGGLSIPGL